MAGIGFPQRIASCFMPIAQCWIPTAEDVVIQKLRWQRRKDLDDVVNILGVSGCALDWAYLTRWTQQHGTANLLQQLRSELPDFGDFDQSPATNP